MTLVAGVDSSTQSCKVVVLDAGTGALVRAGPRRAIPDGTEVDPDALVAGALQRPSTTPAGSTTSSALSVAGQQHGMVLLDAEGSVIRPALLWNDTRSAESAAATSSTKSARRTTRSGRAWCRWRPSRSPSCAGSGTTSPTTPPGWPPSRCRTTG